MEAEEYVFSLPQEQVKFKPSPITKRILAYLIDITFFYFTFFSLYMSIFISFFGFSEDIDFANLFLNDPTMMNRFAIAVYLSSMILLLYFVLFEKEGGSIGKKILRLRVMGENGLSHEQLLIRNLTKTLLFPLLPIDLLGMMFTGKKFTDQIAKTNVYEQEKLDIVFEHVVPENREILSKKRSKRRRK
ncbi:MAG: RDD family protein [Candidatus Parvarchaeota archaeon]|nr:RDD family protein [Candidatus Jingweiarchaeum tengchongense]MCW1298564.1 RDD family protein [Candidatus Jingweiarchaeum tengchongense]MCW1304587.1 RDD family protein [Candidatus Jingweiarchaeum tengchongense]MCW1309176.1 RDD family protein [Candidatus Jingweiarchaeum tengchongense]MCW1310259.1 RDD family protein [Candidatus Jingweiarchaeum tengchongense]